MTTSYRPARTWALWDDLKLRLDSATMQTILGNGIAITGRVYIEGEELPALAAGVPGARLAIVPTDTLWPDQWAPGETERLGFLIRAEAPRIEGHRVGRALEAAQAEAFALLNGYTPAALAYVFVALRVFLFRRWQPLPLWDPERLLSYVSAEYRCEVVGLT